MEPLSPHPALPGPQIPADDLHTRQAVQQLRHSTGSSSTRGPGQACAVGVKNLFPLTKLLYLGNNYFREFGKTHPATRRQPRQRGTLRCGLRVHGSWGRWLTPSSIGSRGRGKPFDLEMGQLILPGTERVPPSTRSGLHPCPTFDWVTGWPRGSSGEKGP